MKYHITCPYCQHTKTAYTLPLNQGMLEAFIKFADLFIIDERPKKKGEIGLSNPQYSNFQNLRYFGIINQSEKGKEWFLTEKGKEFYYGDIGLPSPVAFMEGESLTSDHEAWETHEGERKTIFIKDVLTYYYKQKPEYQEEKSDQYSFI